MTCPLCVITGTRRWAGRPS
ncbi:hypothetical protein ACGFZQ_41415 [Streptomyces sp. NPDC048254]